MGQNKKGFTLVEIMVVIAIVGVLASITAVALEGSKKKARDARRVAQLNQLVKVLGIYSESNGDRFPDSLSVLVPGYISEVPKDPTTGEEYFYCASGTAGGTDDGTAFHLAAALETFNPLYFDRDSDLEDDECEDLPGNPSFNGYSEDCAGTQKCNGENCDGCLDFSNIWTPSLGGAEDPDPSGPPEGWNLNVYVYPYNNGIARISWSPPPGQGGRYNTYQVRATGEFYNWSNPPRWESKTNVIDSNAINNFVELHSLKPGTQYSVVVDARMGATTVETSNTLHFTTTSDCGNQVCDEGETIDQCSSDCQEGIADYPPTPPTSVGLMKYGTDQMMIYWSDGWDKEGAPAHYVHTQGLLQVGGNWVQSEKREAAAAAPFYVSGLQPGQEYTFYIEAVDSSGQTAESARVTGTR